MKTLLVALVWFVQTLPALTADKAPSGAVGCVVYKRQVDAGATFAEYRSYKDFGTAIVVIDGTGGELRVLDSYRPLFIPYPSDPAADRQKAIALLQLARKTYPDVNRRLTLVEKTWTDAPLRFAPAAAIPQPVASPPVSSPSKNAAAVTEIVTTTGIRYTNVRVSGVVGDLVTIAHDAGVSRVRIADLSEETKKKYANEINAEEVARAKAFVAKRESLMTEGHQQEEAANYDNALDLFQKANVREDIQRVASLVAKQWEDKKDYESAVSYYEIAGLYREAGRIRTTHDLSKTASRRKLSDQEIFKQCSPACVTILSGGKSGVGLGSGFFLAKGGYILTNKHVIEGATVFGVLTAANEALEAKLVQSSDVPDLALLKVELKDHPVIKLGDSDKVESGAHAAAIGSPQGQALSITAGSISNADRTFRDNKCFQISVLINHGNSGGPLLDEMGQVIGINTFGLGSAGLSSRSGKGIGTDIQGINYAIKINEAKKLLKDNIPGF